MHAFDYLHRSDTVPQPGVCVLFGGQRFLKQLVLHSFRGNAGEDDEFSTTRFEESPEWRVLMDEVMTTSLFGGNKRVIVDKAEEFVTKYRERLEDVVQRRLSATLILIVDSWPSNTRLYKQIDQHGLQINCELPETTRGRTKGVDVGKLDRWLAEYARSTYGLVVEPKAIRLLCDLTESNLGRIDSELAKLSLYIPEEGAVDLALVEQHVGGWIAKTMWVTVDAMADGRLKDAIESLDRLLLSGEHPLALYGQLSWSLRRYPRAVEIYDRMRQKAARPDVSSAVSKAGFRSWGDEVPRAQHNLKRLGRARVERLGTQLLACDLALKGSHSADSRGRLLLEMLAASLAMEKNG